VRCFKPIIETAIKEKVDLVIHAGDWFDKNMLMNSPARTESIKLIKELADVAPIVMVRGNHDPEGSLDELPMLRANHRIYLFTDIQYMEIYEEGRTPFEIVAVPYMKKSDFNIPETMSIVEADKHVAKAIVKKFSKFPQKKALRFFVGHITVTNATLANSQTISSNDVLLSPSDLKKADADAYFLGHIHYHEQKVLKGLPMKYSGPHYRTRFDEEQELGFWIWENMKWKRYKTPSRKAVTIHLTEDEVREYVKNDKDLDFSEYADDWENTDIKIKLDVPEELSSFIDADVLEEVTGAKVEKRIIPKITARSHEISTVKTLLDKFRIWAKARDIEVTPAMETYVDALEEGE
jgi:DNA repair exonuclease SbcCD nuclease subunit